jgi:DNA-binding Lrp family transcriptional regulator
VGTVAAAYVLINTAPGRAGEARKTIAEIAGVKSAHAVTGAYDIIAYIEGGDVSELGNKVVSQIQSIDGIAQTMTSVVVELP